MFELIALGEVKPDFVSSCIQRKIRANYSHIAILKDGKFVFHATGKGVNRTTLDRLLADGPCVIRRRVEIPVENEDIAYGWLLGRLGLRYSNLQYLGFIFPFLRFLPFVNNGRREAVCSELGADFVVDCSNQKWIASKAYGDCDFIDPKQCMDIAAGIFGEKKDA